MGASTYAWLRRLGYQVDPSLAPRPSGVRAPAGPLLHPPFDPVALSVLQVLVDLLIPGSSSLNLPPASEAGVLDYLVSQAAAPGLAPVRTEILKLTRLLNLWAKKDYNKTFPALDRDTQDELLRRVASGQGQRKTFHPARALEVSLRFCLEGYLGHPFHGGNREAKVWDALAIPMPRSRSPHHQGGHD